MVSNPNGIARFLVGNRQTKSDDSRSCTPAVIKTLVPLYQERSMLMHAGLCHCITVWS